MLAAGGSVTAAAGKIGMTRQALYQAKSADPEFAREWDDAIEAGTDVLEDEAVRRAKDGSDTLLIFTLKARRPDKFKDRAQVDSTVTFDRSSLLRDAARISDE